MSGTNGIIRTIETATVQSAVVNKSSRPESFPRIASILTLKHDIRRIGRKPLTGLFYTN